MVQCRACACILPSPLSVEYKYPLSSHFHLLLYIFAPSSALVVRLMLLSSFPYPVTLRSDLDNSGHLAIQDSCGHPFITCSALWKPSSVFLISFALIRHPSSRFFFRLNIIEQFFPRRAYLPETFELKRKNLWPSKGSRGCSPALNSR